MEVSRPPLTSDDLTTITDQAERLAGSAEALSALLGNRRARRALLARRETVEDLIELLKALPPLLRAAGGAASELHTLRAGAADLPLLEELAHDR